MQVFNYIDKLYISALFLSVTDKTCTNILSIL